MTFFKIDGAKPLHLNFMFWFVTLTPLIIATYFAVPLIEGLQFTRTSEGYNNFISIFKLPLWVASGSLIFGVIVARFHSSTQRALTIQQSILQNNFSNFLNHRDHFQKYLNPISDNFSLKTDPFKIYGIVFSDSQPSKVTITISTGIYEYFESKFKHEFWSKMKVSSPNFTTGEVNTYFSRFLKSVGINAEDKEILNFEQLKKQLINIRKLYRRAMEFGVTRNDSMKTQEVEENGFAMLIGEFSQWANESGFNRPWK